MEEKEIGSVVFTPDSIVLKTVGDKKIVYNLRQRFDLEVGSEFINYQGQTWIRK
jgi:hypothetical protein